MFRKRTLLASFLAFCLLAGSVFVPLNAKYSESVLSFDQAKKIDSMTSAYSSYAITKAGDLLKRVSFQGVVSDFLVKFVDGVGINIPLNKTTLKKSSYYFGLDQNINILVFGSKLKLIFTAVFFALIGMLINSSAIAYLQSKKREMLSVLARSRAHFHSVNNNLIKANLLFNF